MEILFLGTGAADWPYLPAPEDAADTQNRIRRTSSSLIDGRILIDPAPASHDFARRLGVDCSKIELCLLTHTHSDHYNADALAAFFADAPAMRFVCSEKAVAACPGLPAELPIQTIRLMEQIVWNKYTITALPGNHLETAGGEMALHYVLDDGEKKLFYGLDGAWFTAPEWAWLMHRELDMAVLDCTCGDYTGDFRLGTHNSIPMIRIMEPSMRQNAMLKPDGRIVLQHLARTLHKPNAQVEADMAREGYTVARDGLRLKI